MMIKNRYYSHLKKKDLFDTLKAQVEYAENFFGLRIEELNDSEV